MACNKEIPIATREMMVKPKNEGKSHKDISEIVGRSRSSVQYVCQKYNATGSVANKPRSGQPPKLNSAAKRSILMNVRDNPKLSAPKIVQNLQSDYNVKVCPQTVRNMLNEAGYKGRIARKKPFINKINKAKRLDFAKTHLNKPSSFWDNVIFSDETKINIHGSDGRVTVWRKPNQHLKTKNLCGTVKHGGGSLMLWGCMNASGVGRLHIIESIMDKHLYLDILKENLHASAEKFGISGSFIFQQDNDPKHTAFMVKEWLLYNCPKQLHTPPQSPDMNPIEHLWAELKKRIKTRIVKNKKDLAEVLKDEWNRIEPEVTKKLVESMQRRLMEVIKVKGGPTDY